MKEQVVTVKNLAVHYKVFGEQQSLQSSSPLLVLHGWRSNSERWQKIGELLEQKGVQMIVPDLPGFGKSQEPLQSWSIDNYVDWVQEFSEKVPELQKGFNLLGHSFGGAIAVKFAIKYNQKVLRLFLVAAACVRKRTGVKKFWLYVSKVAKVFTFIPYYALAKKAFYKYIIRRSDYPLMSGVMKETYLKVISHDVSHRLFFVKVPTVIIWGDKDTSTPLEEGKFIHKKISGSELVVIPGAEHPIQLQFPELLAEKISGEILQKEPVAS